MSREHPVSKGLFTGPTVVVSGKSWCKQPKEVGIGALTAKILCSTHNSGLSEVDLEAQKFMRSLDSAWKISAAARRSCRIPTRVEGFDVDARRLERWALKTLINLTLDSKLPIGAEGEVPGTPPAWMARVAFGLDGFTGDAGLYFAAHAGQEMRVAETVVFAPLIKQDRCVLGGLFEFTGFTLVLWLDQSGVPEAVGQVPNMSPAWGSAKLTRMLDRINVISAPLVLAAVIKLNR